MKSISKNITVIFVYGRPGCKPNLEGDNLYLDCPEAYEKLSEKVYQFYDYCMQNFEFDYIFKTDDDSVPEYVMENSENSPLEERQRPA